MEPAGRWQSSFENGFFDFRKTFLLMSQDGEQESMEEVTSE